MYYVVYGFADSYSSSCFKLAMANIPAFWLRCETKEFERRVPLTLRTAKLLIDAGFDNYVERDEQRIFDDSEYEAYVCQSLVFMLPSATSQGYTLVANNSWKSARSRSLSSASKTSPHHLSLSGIPTSTSAKPTGFPFFNVSTLKDEPFTI